MPILPLKEKEYRDRAAECERMAEEALNSQVQEQYRDAAHQWRELARQAKLLGKSASKEYAALRRSGRR